MTENNEPTAAELDTLQELRQESAQHVTESIEMLEKLVCEAEQRGDGRGAARIRERITPLERKREEILNGQR